MLGIYTEAFKVSRVADEMDHLTSLILSKKVFHHILFIMLRIISTYNVAHMHSRRARAQALG